MCFWLTEPTCELGSNVQLKEMLTHISPTLYGSRALLWTGVHLIPKDTLNCNVFRPKLVTIPMSLESGMTAHGNLAPAPAASPEHWL